MADLARQAGLSESFGGGAKDKAECDARFVGDFTDDLTIAIALMEFERAVQLVEDGKDAVSSSYQSRRLNLFPGEKQAGSIPTLVPQLTALMARSRWHF
jgi:hypothetical protein